MDDYDYQRVLSGEIRRGWQLLIPRTYFHGNRHLLCDYGWSKEIKGDNMIRKEYDSSILITENNYDSRTVKVRRFSTISPKINADLAVIHYRDVVSFINSVYLSPSISGVVFEVDMSPQRLNIVVFNAFSPQEKFANWKTLAPEAASEYEYDYSGSMFLDEHSHRLIIIFWTFKSIVNTILWLLKGFAMVAYGLSMDYSTVLNDGVGTIICKADVKRQGVRCISLSDNEAIMRVDPDGANGPEFGDVIIIDRTGIKRRQSLAQWLEISESERPDFMHVMESYRSLLEPTNIFANSSQPLELYFAGAIMSRCIAGSWYTTTGDILCKRTQVDSLKNLAAKAVVRLYPSEMDGAQLRADLKNQVGFDVFEAVVEEQPLNVEIN